MNLIKIIKFLLMGTATIYFFPSFNNGLINFILKFLFYLLLMYIVHIIINDGINFIIRNWSQAHLRYIDEREHIKGNSLNNIFRMDFIGAMFRVFHYMRFNRKKIFQEFIYLMLENLAVVITTVLIFIIILGFIFYSLYFLG